MRISLERFRQMAVTGRELHQKLDESIRTKGHTFVPLSEIEHGYKIRLDVSDQAALNSDQHGMLEVAEQSSNGFFLTHVGNPINQRHQWWLSPSIATTCRRLAGHIVYV